MELWGGGWMVFTVCTVGWVIWSLGTSEWGVILSKELLTLLTVLWGHSRMRMYWVVNMYAMPCRQNNTIIHCLLRNWTWTCLVIPKTFLACGQFGVTATLYIPTYYFYSSPCIYRWTRVRHARKAEDNTIIILLFTVFCENWIWTCLYSNPENLPCGQFDVKVTL